MSPSAADFRLAYLKVADSIGVKMSPEDDPEKAFAARTRGTVLGVTYDTVNWTWELPTDKLARLIAQINAALDSDTMQQCDIWSLVGKLIHYCPLVPTGRFNIRHLIKLNNASTLRRTMTAVPSAAKRQLWYWRTLLLATAGLASIPVLPALSPAWATEFYTDAAGGSHSTPGLGCGAVSANWWFFHHWGSAINSGSFFEGRRLSQKLSALELVAPLVCIASNPELVRNRPVRIFVDNAGAVHIWRKGYSTSCSLSSCLVGALAAVAAALGCSVDIVKIDRCSCVGASLADALSKSAFARFDLLAAQHGWTLPVAPAAVPRAIVRWIECPSDNERLGEEILTDLMKTSLIPGYNC